MQRRVLGTRNPGPTEVPPPPLALTCAPPPPSCAAPPPAAAAPPPPPAGDGRAAGHAGWATARAQRGNAPARCLAAAVPSGPHASYRCSAPSAVHLADRLQRLGLWQRPRGCSEHPAQVRAPPNLAPLLLGQPLGLLLRLALRLDRLLHAPHSRRHLGTLLALATCRRRLCCCTGAGGGRADSSAGHKARGGFRAGRQADRQASRSGR